MRFVDCNFSVSKNPKLRLLLISVFWFVGFIFGTLAGSFSDVSSASLMLRFSYGSMSIVGLITVICLPFFIMAFAFYIRQFTLLLLISFLKSFSYGFASVLILFTFGEVHWFMKGILMFSNIGCSVVLGVLLYRIVTATVTSRSILIGAICNVLFGLADFWIVAPLMSASVGL